MAALAPLLAVAFLAAAAQAADPFAFFDWDVSYITASPLGVPQQVRPYCSLPLPPPPPLLLLLVRNRKPLDFASSYLRARQHFVFYF
jgi:hypothetical protein